MSADMSGEGAGGESAPALQVVVLGSGGGPREDNATSLLLRSVSSSWHKSSLITLDGGTYLSTLIHLLSQPDSSIPPDGPLPYTIADSSSPFNGLTLPYRTPEANAGYITSTLVDAHLITHPHLDHISGIVMATAGPPGTKPKKIAALPGTIQAFRSCVFNDILWPNLSDENGGAGMVTYLRLVEGGSHALGEGSAKGYSEICDGLLVKGYTVAHGTCVGHKGQSGKSVRGGSASSGSSQQRQGSYDSGTMSYAGNNNHMGSSISLNLQNGGHSLRSSPRSLTFQQQGPPPRRGSLLRDAVSPSQTWPSTPGQGGQGANQFMDGQGGGEMEVPAANVVESSAYFIQDQLSAKEILVFGDVEPDTISLTGKNRVIWREAAPKIVAGRLTGIFIECSYSDAHDNDRLYGHLKPVFVVEELCALAREVQLAATGGGSGNREQIDMELRKRKRRGTGGSEGEGRSRGSARRSMTEGMFSPKSGPQRVTTSCPPVESPSRLTPDTPHIATPLDAMSLAGDTEADTTIGTTNTDDSQIGERDEDGEEGGGEKQKKRPLEGVRVVIIHVKEKLDDKGDPGDVILEELRGHAEQEGLGCEFVVARKGMSLMF